MTLEQLRKEFNERFTIAIKVDKGEDLVSANRLQREYNTNYLNSISSFWLSKYKDLLQNLLTEVEKLPLHLVSPHILKEDQTPVRAVELSDISQLIDNYIK